jgi:hypothetical protein
MGYLLAAPGWAPDGKGETTRALQAQMKREQMAARRTAKVAS